MKKEGIGTADMRISIITVSFNCKNTIEKTLYSVANQKNQDYEYIIIDGGSTDGTMELIQAYSNIIENMYIVSEPDNGIYDAMNKGILKASGDYIFFLNSGDVFYNDFVLAEVMKYLDLDFDIFWGNVIKNNIVETYPSQISKFRLVALERMICHQAIFAKKELLEKYLFDTTFKICADRDWLINVIFRYGATYYYMKNLIICDYDCTGISSSNYKTYSIESMRIAKRNYGYFVVFFIWIKRIIGRILGHRW